MPVVPAHRASQIEYAIRDVTVPAQHLRAQGHEILDLNIGDPNKFDHDTPENVREAAVRAIRGGKNGYTPSYGVPELIEAIVEKERADGVDVAEGDVIVGTGVTEVLQMIFGGLLDPGDEVLVPGPTYPPYIAYPRFFGGRPITYRTIEEERWRPDLEDIRAKMGPRTKAVAVINPNNPTGALYPPKTLKALADLVGEREDVVLISDEIYDKLVFEEPAVSPASLAKDVPTLVLNGISKVYAAPGWRCGYVAIRDAGDRLSALRDAIERQARARLCSNSISQYAYAEALRGPQDSVAAFVDTLRVRRDIAYERLNGIEGLSCAKPGGAFYAFPRIEPGVGVDDKAFVLDLLNDQKVLTVHGSGFCPTYGRGHFRIVFLPPPDLLHEAFDRIEAFMQRRRRG